MEIMFFANMLVKLLNMVILSQLSSNTRVSSNTDTVIASMVLGTMKRNWDWRSFPKRGLQILVHIGGNRINSWCVLHCSLLPKRIERWEKRAEEDAPTIIPRTSHVAIFLGEKIDLKFFRATKHLMRQWQYNLFSFYLKKRTWRS